MKGLHLVGFFTQPVKVLFLFLILFLKHELKPFWQLGGVVDKFIEVEGGGYKVAEFDLLFDVLEDGHGWPFRNPVKLR